MVASQKIKMFHFPFSLFFEDKWKVKQARNELTHNLVNNVVIIKFNKGKSSFGSGFFVCYHVDTFNCSVLAKVIFEVLFFLVFQSSHKHFLDCGICFWFSNFLRKKSQPSINLFPLLYNTHDKICCFLSKIVQSRECSVEFGPSYLKSTGSPMLLPKYIHLGHSS